MTITHKQFIILASTIIALVAYRVISGQLTIAPLF